MFASTLVVGHHLCRFLFCDRTLEGWVLLLLLSPGFHSPREALLLSSGFFPQENLFFEFVPRFLPPREAGASDVAALASGLFLRVSSPQGKLGRLMLPRSPKNCYFGFCPPSEAGAASMTSRSPAGEAVPFIPGVLSSRGSSLLFLEVLFPKGFWGGVDDAALASG